MANPMTTPVHTSLVRVIGPRPGRDCYHWSDCCTIRHLTQSYTLPTDRAEIIAAGDAWVPCGRCKP